MHRQAKSTHTYPAERGPEQTIHVARGVFSGGFTAANGRRGKRSCEPLSTGGRREYVTTGLGGLSGETGHLTLGALSLLH